MIKYYIIDRVDELDESLLPPSLDCEVTVEERLSALVHTLHSSTHTTKLLAFDLKQQYKVLATTCGVALKATCGDPKIADWLLDPGAKEKTLHRMVTNYLPNESHLLDG